MSLFDEAKQFIPGGVNSPVRAFAGVGGEPVFMKGANGAWLETEDGRRMIDYIGSWGPMILGHQHPSVTAAVSDAAKTAFSFGAPTVIETSIARKVCEFMPSIDKVRMVSSGTEATMSAIRLARGHTGRDKIVKFEGCYHGHSDSLLVKAGSGLDEQGVRVAVVAALELDDLVAARVAARQANRAHRRFRAGADHADLVDRRHELADLSRNRRLDDRRCAEAERRLCGIADGGCDRRVLVPQDHGTP